LIGLEGVSAQQLSDRRDWRGLRLRDRPGAMAGRMQNDCGPQRQHRRRNLCPRLEASH